MTKRAKWKGPYVNLKQKKNSYVLEASRDSLIVPKFVNKTFEVHNGKNCVLLNITEDMIGHKFGEFVFTRKKHKYKKKK